MKVRISLDEEWPVFSLSVGNDFGYGVEINSDLYTEYEAIQRQYEIMQHRLQEIYMTQVEAEK